VRQKVRIETKANKIATKIKGKMNTTNKKTGKRTALFPCL
jgi:hypothetical protein